MVKNIKSRWWATRGLDKMEKKFGNSKPIETFIKQRLKSQKVVRVLEFGFGDGKCLLDLRTVFPDKQVELYGINKEKGKVISKGKDFMIVAKEFELHIPNSKLLPKPFFYDAGNGLKFKLNYFDVIISQVAFHYVGDKAKLLEEFWRVLKPEGRAFLEIDSYKPFYPDFMQINKETPRFVIYNEHKLIKLSNYLKKISNNLFDIKLKLKNSSGGSFIFMEKNTNKHLKLGLEYEEDLSFDLTRFNKEKKIEGVWWGTRSVFKIKRV